MKQIIYLAVLSLILVLAFIFARTGSEIINENIPTKSSNVLEKEYEKYEMNNYR
tara:strand:- start:469 stop:630 length:162 start_codon:yes stop_codon:yes gene_type:complete